MSIIFRCTSRASSSSVESSFDFNYSSREHFQNEIPSAVFSRYLVPIWKDMKYVEFFIESE